MCYLSDLVLRYRGKTLFILMAKDAIFISLTDAYFRVKTLNFQSQFYLNAHFNKFSGQAMVVNNINGKTALSD